MMEDDDEMCVARGGGGGGGRWTMENDVGGGVPGVVDDGFFSFLF